MADLVTMAINAARGKKGEAIYDPLLKPAAPATPVSPLDPRMASIEERRMRSWKHPFGEACPHGRHIMLVDGTHVRNIFDSDFSQGGNGYAYDFVPKDEIWIDEQIDPVEWPFIAFHECEEAELMEQGMSYDKAHDKVKYAEDIFRRRLMEDR